MKDAHVLVVEDESDVRELVCTILRRAGMVPIAAESGREGVRKLYEGRPDLVVLDIAMPDMDGWEAIEHIRAVADVPILMLTARTAESDKVRALGAGADDYVTKPFGRRELVARIEALLRRAGTSLGPDAYADGLVSVDFREHRATTSAGPLELTPIEFRLLSVFVRHADQLLSHEQILQLVWGDAETTRRAQVKLYVGYLRRKLVAATGHDPIETVRGYGYRYNRR